MQPGDLVAWGQEYVFLSPPGYTSTFLILQPDPVRTNLTGESTWLALSCRGNMVVVHEDAMRVVSETR
jgi:hypothetical protein